MINSEDGSATSPPAAAGSGQRSLIERAESVLSQDDRVLGVWLAGSFGRGTDDRYSDVDLWVVVGDGDLDAFCADWPSLCDRIAPIVLRRQLRSQPIFNQISTDWTRFDVSVGTPDKVGTRTTSTVKALYDPHGLSEQLLAPRGPKQPDPQRIQALTEEFFRILGLLPVVVGRGEFIVGQSDAGLVRGLLIDLMLEDVAVEERGGALHLNRLLAAEQRQILVDLPQPKAERESVIAAHLAGAAAFLPLARDLHQRCGLDWPQQIDEAARRHLSETLSVDLPG